MPGQGIHYALDICELEVWEELHSDSARFSFMEIILRSRESDWYQVTDKAWEGIHFCFSQELTEDCFSRDSAEDQPATPLQRCIFSGENLYKGRNGYYLGYSRPGVVKEVATALGPIDEGWMRQHYWSIDPDAYGMEPSQEDFEYIWQWFQLLQTFYQRAAQNNRAVLFEASWD